MGHPALGEANKDGSKERKDEKLEIHQHLSAGRFPKQEHAPGCRHWGCAWRNTPCCRGRGAPVVHGAGPLLGCCCSGKTQNNTVEHFSKQQRDSRSMGDAKVPLRPERGWLGPHHEAKLAELLGTQRAPALGAEGASRSVALRLEGRLAQRLEELPLLLEGGQRRERRTPVSPVAPWSKTNGENHHAGKGTHPKGKPSPARTSKGRTARREPSDL